MSKQQPIGCTTVNKFTTQRGITRTLEVEVNDDHSIDIEFTLQKGELQKYNVINLTTRETLSLIYYLIRVLLPHKFLSSKFKRMKEE